FFADGEVQMVGRAIMDDLYFAVGKEAFDAAVSFGNVELVRLGFGEGIIGFAERNHLNKAKPAGGFNVGGADETRPDNACFNGFHLTVCTFTQPFSFFEATTDSRTATHL